MVPELQVVTDDGCTLAVQTSGGGEPVLLLAGQSNNHHWWDRVRPALDQQCATISLDWRGTGHSDDPGRGWSIERFTADVRCVLDELGLAGCAVYGTSMGGRVAQRLAAEAPWLVTRLVLGCTTPGGRHAVERSQQVRRLLASPDPAAVARTTAELFYTPAWMAANPGPYTTLGDPSASRAAKAGHLRASNRHDAWSLLGSITAPTLVLHGSDDQLAPVENAHLLAARIPQARAVVLDGARHGYFDECAP